MPSSVEMPTIDNELPSMISLLLLVIGLSQAEESSSEHSHDPGIMVGGISVCFLD